MHGIFLLLHILAATIWTGGHLVLACSILPSALKQGSVAQIEAFESAYERIGIPALVIQVLTGLMLAKDLVPPSAWLDLGNPVARLIALKILLLATTVGFALDARLRIIPNLRDEDLVPLAWHIVPVTVVSVLFVVVGVAFRTGWFY